MKRIIALFFAVFILCAASFAKNAFGNRFFEVKTGASVDFSNNLFSCNDFLKKNLVIDLQKISKDCPKNGFDVRVDVNPSLEFNLNIINMHFGIVSGVDVYEKFVIGKDLFDFFGKGNSIGQTLDVSFKNSTEVFTYTELDVGFVVGKVKVLAKPAMFVPLLSIRDSGGSIKVTNTSDGIFDVSMNVNMDIYSAYDLKSVDGNIEVDPESMKNSVITGAGFDLGGTITYQWNDTFALDLVCHFPVIPGHLTHKSTVTGGSSYKMNILDSEKSDKTSIEPAVINEATMFMVNRPLKVGLYADKGLLGNLLAARVGAGLGIQRPFCEGAYAYPEYYLGLTLNLINIFKFGLSTQYRDQLFIHQFGASVNVRVVQLDLGISSQSSSFKKSFEVSGLGAYVYLSIGF